jgi:hypothetical protein
MIKAYVKVDGRIAGYLARIQQGVGGGDGKFCLSSPVTGAELTAGEAGQLSPGTEDNSAPSSLIEKQVRLINNNKRITG